MLMLSRPTMSKNSNPETGGCTNFGGEMIQIRETAIPDANKIRVQFMLIVRYEISVVKLFLELANSTFVMIKETMSVECSNDDFQFGVFKASVVRLHSRLASFPKSFSDIPYFGNDSR